MSRKSQVLAFQKSGIQELQLQGGFQQGSGKNIEGASPHEAGVGSLQRDCCMDLSERSFVLQWRPQDDRNVRNVGCLLSKAGGPRETVRREAMLPAINRKVVKARLQSPLDLTGALRADGLPCLSLWLFLWSDLSCYFLLFNLLYWWGCEPIYVNSADPHT